MDPLDIGYGLSVSLQIPATWRVRAKSGSFDLVEIADFFRVVTLLERSHLEVESLFSEYAKGMKAKEHFPLWKVAGAGLMSQSDQWASLALTWFPSFSQSEKASLADLLRGVVCSKWASQKTRQLAERYSMRGPEPSS